VCRTAYLRSKQCSLSFGGCGVRHRTLIQKHLSLILALLHRLLPGPDLAECSKSGWHGKNAQIIKRVTRPVNK